MTPHLCYESAVDLLGGILRCWAKDAERDAGELCALADFLELPPTGSPRGWTCPSLRPLAHVAGVGKNR